MKKITSVFVDEQGGMQVRADGVLREGALLRTDINASAEVMRVMVQTVQIWFPSERLHFEDDELAAHWWATQCDFLPPGMVIDPEFIRTLENDGMTDEEVMAQIKGAFGFLAAASISPEGSG